MKTTVLDIVIEKVVKAVEEGKNLPWDRSWAQIGMPTNIFTGKRYRGTNIICLAFDQWGSNYYATAKQVNEKGGRIIKEQYGSPSIVAFYQMLTDTRVESTADITSAMEGKEKKIPMLKYYRVYNYEQMEGIEHPPIQKNLNDPIEECERVVREMKNPPKIVSIESNKAFYIPAMDKITTPLITQFKDKESYYSTLFHELGHATGHESRLDRFSKDKSADNMSDYGVEELIAEFTSCIMLGMLGVNKNTDRSAAYIQGWMKVIQNEPRILVKAAGQAQKAADLICNVTFDKVDQEVQLTQ